MFALFLFLSTLSSVFLSLLIFSVIRRTRKAEQQSSSSITQSSLSKFADKNTNKRELDLTRMTNSLLLETLPSNSPESDTLFSGEAVSEEPGLDKESVDSAGDDCSKKKKKKRAKKKRPDSPILRTGEERSDDKERLAAKEKQELVSLYPFTSSSSLTQRKIKQQYDQLVKSDESNGLTLAEVGEFVNCLIEAKNELQHKSEVIQRKFTITKALLFKADRSSFERLCQQIYRLELEQKRLEEDVFVYNWLQQELKLSPAYRKMLEISICMELKDNSSELTESTDAEFANISFEEFLAQEKKDSFWQKNRKLGSCSG